MALIRDEAAFLQALKGGFFKQIFARKGVGGSPPLYTKADYLRQAGWPEGLRQGLARVPDSFFTGFTMHPEQAPWLVQQLQSQRWGSVLEFGSGLSTILMALACPAPTKIYSLEHEAAWHKVTAQALKVLGLASRVKLIVAPLRKFKRGPETFQVHELKALKQARVKADFLLIDSPPGVIGRGGVLPAVGGYLKPGCLVVLDDAERVAEREWVRRWTKEGRAELLGYVPLGRGAAVLRA